MYLVFDASGIAKPKNWKASFSDTFSWPRMIHLSWIILDEKFKPIQDFNCIVQPEDFKFTPEIASFCKLDEDDLKKAVPLDDVLNQFNDSLDGVEYLFAHNMNFNENVLACEFLRKGINHNLFKKERHCLMHESTFYCKIPSKTGGYKWPSLQEMHATIFKQKYTPSNNARADVIAASRCFIALMKVGAFEDLFDDE